MARLRLTPDQAKLVIKASERREPGPGHTMERHVTISNLDLYERNNRSAINGEIQFFAAFTSLDQCAQALSLVIDTRARDRFFENFGNLPDATNFAETVEVPQVFRVRYSAGQQANFPVTHFHLAARRMVDRPYGLHVITFYPTLRF